MELNNKIKQILVDKSISPSHFADEIGVQRSSISHILAGRNKPSLDIVQKIIRRYPDLGMDWILEDDHPIGPPISLKLSESGVETDNSTTRIKGRSALDSHTEKIKPDAPIQSNPEANRVVDFEEKAIERILIFYADGTFRQYRPY